MTQRLTRAERAELAELEDRARLEALRKADRDRQAGAAIRAAYDELVAARRRRGAPGPADAPSTGLTEQERRNLERYERMYRKLRAEGIEHPTNAQLGVRLGLGQADPGRTVQRWRQIWRAKGVIPTL